MNASQWSPRSDLGAGSAPISEGGRMSQVVEVTRGTKRHRGNQVAGWATAFGVWVLVLALDPLALYGVWEDGGNGFSAVNVGYLAWWAALSCFMFSVFARPRLEFGADELVLRNVRRDVFIPYGAVQELDDDGSMHLRIRAAGRWYRAWGAERSNLATMAGHPALGGVALKEGGGRSEAEVTSPVQVRRRRLESGEWVLIVLWAGYVLAALFFGVSEPTGA